MESKGNGLWMGKPTSASILRRLSAASVLENQGSGNFSSTDGSLPSCSSSSSERNSSTNLTDEDAEVSAILEDGEVRAMLKDADVRAVLRKVTINEGVLNMAIQSLGGGEKGLKNLMVYIMMWVKQRRDIKSSSQQPPPSPPPSNPARNFSTAQNVVPQPSSDAIQILGGILQSPPTTQLLDQEMRCTQRSKSRKLMTGEPEVGAGLVGLGTGFCPSSFIRSPEDRKPEVTSPDILTPGVPQVNYGMQQQHPVTPFTSAYIAMPSTEPPPAMTTKAARRHRMARQRQSFRARAGSPDATAPVSVGGGSLWKTTADTPPALTSSGMSGVQATPPSAPVTAAREVLRGIKKKNGRLDIEPVQVEFAQSSATGSLEGQPSLHENGTLVQRLYGGNPSDRSDKESSVNSDDDRFLDELILSMGPSFESDSSSIQTLERFPSLTLDFPFEEIMAVTRTESDGT